MTEISGTAAPPMRQSGSSARVCVNGRFLAQPTTGVQRFARETLAAVDLELSQRGTRTGASVWELLVPDYCETVPEFQSIQVRAVPGPRGQLWDQLLPFHVRKGDALVHLTNGGSILHRRSLSVLHDASVYRTPENYTFSYRTFQRILGRLLASRARVATVSEFSRGELAQVLRLDPRSIVVTPNGSEHMASLVPDAGVLSRLSLRSKGYFLAIGSPARNKNLRLAVQAVASLGRPDVPLVVVGSLQRKVFGQSLDSEMPGLLLAGRRTDEEIKALIQNALALVFPSIYEGFGIPPLEAMSFGCPVVASEIPSVVEVCGDAALYFPPTDATSLAKRLSEVLEGGADLPGLTARGHARAAAFSWRRSAQELIRASEQLLRA